MAEIRDFGITAGGNNVSGDLFVEGQLVPTLNNSARELQAALRRAFNQLEWFAIGDTTGAATFTFLAATQFRVVGASLASRYHVGRRVRAIGSSTGTITGTITAVVGGANTDVTVAWDSGALVSETLLIELGVNSAVGSSVPGIIDHDVEVDGDLEATGDLEVGGDAAITGDLTLSGTLTVTNGPLRLLSVSRVENGTLIVPANTKQIQLWAYGAGGGGGSSNSTFSGDARRGGEGETLAISASGGVSISVPGGRGGNASSANTIDTANGQSLQNNGSGSAAGSTGTYSLENQGAMGGKGAVHATDGNRGDLVFAFFDNPAFSTMTVARARGGNAGTSEGEGTGSDGQDGYVVAHFLG